MSEEKPRSTEEIANAFFEFMLFRMEIIYGNAHKEWWRTEGKNMFFEWAKKQGLEFTDNDFYKNEEYDRPAGIKSC